MLDNLPRILPKNCDALIEIGSWKVPTIFQILEERGRVERDEMYQVFNMGIGMVAIVGAREAEKVIPILKAQRMGRIEDGTGKTRLRF